METSVYATVCGESEQWKQDKGQVGAGGSSAFVLGEDGLVQFIEWCKFLLLDKVELHARQASGVGSVGPARVDADTGINVPRARRGRSGGSWC